jgi:hypothetical protein
MAGAPSVHTAKQFTHLTIIFGETVDQVEDVQASGGS